MGARGVSVRMRSIQDAAAVAFAFKQVLNLPATTVTHYRLINPDLQRRPWPHNDYAASPLKKEWPHSRGVVAYYERWWKNVYHAARAFGLPFARRWRVVEKVAVQPVRASCQLFAVWTFVAKKIARKKNNADLKSRLAVWKLTDMITFFEIESESDGVLTIYQALSLSDEDRIAQ